IPAATGATELRGEPCRDGRGRTAGCLAALHTDYLDLSRGWFATCLRAERARKNVIPLPEDGEGVGGGVFYPRVLAAGIRVSRFLNSSWLSQPIVKQSRQSWASANCRDSSIRLRSWPAPKIFMPITPLPLARIVFSTLTMVAGSASIAT